LANVVLRRELQGLGRLGAGANSNVLTDLVGDSALTRTMLTS
jgi:hypothetical protein